MGAREGGGGHEEEASVRGVLSQAMTVIGKGTIQ